MGQVDLELEDGVSINVTPSDETTRSSDDNGMKLISRSISLRSYNKWWEINHHYLNKFIDYLYAYFTGHQQNKALRSLGVMSQFMRQKIPKRLRELSTMQLEQLLVEVW